MRGVKNIISLVKAARLERALIPISYIMIPAAITNKISLDLFYLIICCILGYSIGGLINAKVDKDFELKGAGAAVIIIFILSFLISLHNYIITIMVFINLIMGYIYNKPSRKILFGDSIILSITHVGIPMFTSSILLGLSILSILPLTVIVMLFYATIDQMSNLNGIKEDKQRGYKTLMTTFKEGKLYTHFLMNISFLIMILIYLFNNFSKKYLFVTFTLLILEVFMNYMMNSKREIEAYGLMRLIAIAFPLAFIYELAKDIRIFLIGSIFVSTYITYYISKVYYVKQNGI